MRFLFLLLFNCQERSPNVSTSSTIGEIQKEFTPDQYEDIPTFPEEILPIQNSSPNSLYFSIPQKEFYVTENKIEVKLNTSHFVCPAVILQAFLKNCCKDGCKVSYPTVKIINDLYEYKLNVTNKEQIPKTMNFIFPVKTFYELKNSKNSWDKVETLTINFQ